MPISFTTMYLHIETKASKYGDKIEQIKGLTVGFAQGKNIPRQKRPSRGPPTIPKMLKAA